MPAYADLEIALHRREAERYTVEMRFTAPDSEAETRLLSDSPTLNFDLPALRQQLLDPAAYGQTLTQTLFGVPEISHAFATARAATASQTPLSPLRVRLFIGASAPELHSMRWETLRDPAPPTDRPLLTDEQLFFSRYLSSYDWQPVRPRAKSELTALVVIANPTGLDPAQLAPVDVSGELSRASAGLGPIKLTALVNPTTPVDPAVAVAGRPTLDQIQAQLRQGYDILYLVSHGQLIGNEPRLYLEDETGQAEVIPGSELVTRLQELPQRPRLVVLASCQSAGTGDQRRSNDQGVLAALGPRLAEIGVPAVLAMQGNISMRTVEQFMPVFFKELQQDGQIDRAMAIARGVVRDRPDGWMPALFMRLKSGRLWYTPGYADAKDGLKKWDALLNNLKKGRVTPILGPGLTETLLGSRQEMARRWADTHHFPMSPYDREDLPQVAQFLAVNQDDMFPRDELLEHVKQELFNQYGSHLQARPQIDLNELMMQVGGICRQNPTDPYRVLATLNLPIYINTNVGCLLEEALKAAGKEPVVEICRWHKDIEWLPSIYDEEPDYRPTVQRPLIYQLFGCIAEPRSLVLTEDDYFDYLIGVTRNDELIPPVVRRSLVDGALLFLGFRLDDWDFRVLFRSIISREGSQRRNRYAHIAAQIDPEEGRILEPEGARRYLESYFQGTDISIYWGSAEDFIKELAEKLGLKESL
jgi:hypothetical protein